MGLSKNKLTIITFFVLLYLLTPALVSAVQAINVNVKISNLSTSETIYEENNLNVGDTSIKDTDGTLHLFDKPTALGALIESSKNGNFPMEVQNTAYGLYVSSINNLEASGWNGWNYMVNGNSPWLGMADYELSNSDQLLIYYGWGYKLAVSKTKINVDEKISLTAYKYNGATFNWEPYPNSDLKVDDNDYNTDSSGIFKTSFPKEGEYKAYLLSSGWPNSPEITITVENKIIYKKPISASTRMLSAQKALDYLKKQVNSSGIIENTALTEWAIIAFGSKGIYSQTIKSNGNSLIAGMKERNPQTLNDYSRRSLACLASGINPNSFNKINLISKIKNYYNNFQFGDKNLINDDIFACLALLASNEDINNYMIRDSLNFIINSQKTDGGFSYSTNINESDVDDSAAVLQLLTFSKKRGRAGLDEAINKTVNYIINSQNDDGGFPYTPEGQFSDSNCASTSWAIMALNSANVYISSLVSKEGNSPFHYIIDLQNKNGSFSWKKGYDKSNLITTYTSTALTNKCWPVVLDTYKGSEKPNSANNNTNNASDKSNVELNSENSSNQITSLISQTPETGNKVNNKNNEKSSVAQNNKDYQNDYSQINNNPSSKKIKHTMQRNLWYLYLSISFALITLFLIGYSVYNKYIKDKLTKIK